MNEKENNNSNINVTNSENSKNDLETVERENCPNCGSEKFYVNHYLREFHHDRIFLECAECGTFAARIIVHAYVDPNPETEYKLFLKKAHQKAYRSARKARDDYEKHVNKSSIQFERVKEILDQKNSTLNKKSNKNKRKERTISELYDEYRIKEDG